MHSLKQPRNAIALAIGVTFIVVAFVYWAVPYFGQWQLDYAGVTMLAALGIAMGLMAYVLSAGTARD